MRSIPGIPIELDDLAETVVKLLKRDLEMKPVQAGLTNTYSIDGTTATAREFLFGDTSKVVSQRHV